MSTFRTLRVSDKYRETERAVCFRFKIPAEHAAQFDYFPGQHVALRAQLDGQELRRTYSLCPTDRIDELRICVRSDQPGRMSGYLLEFLDKSMEIEALPPSGGFHLSPNSGAVRVVGFAAGIGITPIIAIAAALLRRDGESRFTLFFGNRDTGSVLFAEEVQALKNRYLDRFAVHFFMSRETQDIELYNGRIDASKTAAIAPALFDPASTDEVFICGPGSMNADISAALYGMHIDPKRVRSERFALPGDSINVPTAAAGRPFAALRLAAAAARSTVSVRMDGRSKQFDMPRDGTLSILEAAAEAGIDLPYSCKAGVCSTCRTHLDAGEVRMQQNYALEESELEAGFILACQSVPISAMVELNYDTR